MALLNFRDVAELAGGPLLPGRLFRSAQPYHLDDADMAVVNQAGIRTIIDLREPHEQVPPDWQLAESQGLQVLRVSVADQIVPTFDEKSTTGPLGARDESVLPGHRILADFYRAILDNADERMAQVMAAVAQGDPLLVHCAAGKDRTGTTVALLLDLIGSDHKAIVADYLRTQAAVPAIIHQLTRDTPPEKRRDLAKIPAGIVDAPESAIRATLAHITALGGARKVLSRHTDPIVLDRVTAALT